MPDACNEIQASYLCACMVRKGTNITKSCMLVNTILTDSTFFFSDMGNILCLLVGRTLLIIPVSARFLAELILSSTSSDWIYIMEQSF